MIEVDGNGSANNLVSAKNHILNFIDAAGRQPLQGAIEITGSVEKARQSKKSETNYQWIKGNF